MVQEFNRIENVSGELNLPGDKSISHRVVIFSAMADGVSEITNLSDGEDVNSTITCMESIGAVIERAGRSAKVRGKGFKKFTKPSSMLNAGNSGTTTRLLSGLLAAQNFESIIIGDDSLSKRPMERVIQPLKLMGAGIESTDSGTLPIKIFPVKKLNPIDYQLPVASAQVKSAVLIAALHCDGITSVTDNYATRDHTERMLNLKVLKEIGGDIEIQNEKESNGEPFGDIVVKSSKLKNAAIKNEIIPNIIDEIPILSVAGLFAEGSFQIQNAKELRKKESDRIN